MFKHKNNCNCDHCIFKLDNHEEIILKLENKKKQKKNKTNNPKIPTWFKLWDQQHFEPIVDDVNDLKHRVSNLEINAITKNDLKEMLKSSAFKNINNQLKNKLELKQSY